MHSPIRPLYLLFVAAMVGCASGPNIEQLRQQKVDLDLALADRAKLVARAEASPVSETEKFHTALLAESRRISALRSASGMTVTTPYEVNTLFVRRAEIDDYVERARDALTRALKDPGAAQLRDVTYRSSEIPVICGSVNGKNGFGGFTGFRRFYATDTPGFFEIEGDSISPKFEQTFNALCS